MSKGKTVVTLSPAEAGGEDSQRTLKALVMRREGKTYEEIAQRLGVDAWSARQIVSIAYGRLSSELADELRAQVEDRLDDVIRRLYDDLRLAESQSAKNGMYALILKTEAQRSKLLGLDIPVGIPDTTEEKRAF